MLEISSIMASILINFICIPDLLPEKLTIRQLLSLFLILFSLHTVIAFVLPQYFIPSIIFMIIFCLFTTEVVCWSLIFCVLSGYFLVNSLIELFLFLYRTYTRPDIYELKLSFLVYLVICFGIVLPLVKILKGIKNKILYSCSLEQSDTPTIIYLSFCLMLCICCIMISGKIGYNRTTSFVNHIVYPIIFFLSTILLYFFCCRVQSQKQKELMNAYIQNLEKAYSDTRKIKHDYDNVLSSLGEYIQRKDLQSLEEYYQNEIFIFSHQNRKGTFFPELSNIQIPEIKSLLTAKLFEASQNGLSVHLEIMEPVSGFPSPVLHFVRILGIFLDNAIEAAAETQEKQLEIAFMKNQDGLSIVIKNSTLPLDVSLKTTKGLGHGYGLSIASELISKHPEVLWKMDYQDKIFTQILEIRGRNV